MGNTQYPIPSWSGIWLYPYLTKTIILLGYEKGSESAFITKNGFEFCVQERRKKIISLSSYSDWKSLLRTHKKSTPWLVTMPKEECDSVLFKQVGVRITLEFRDNTFNVQQFPLHLPQKEPQHWGVPRSPQGEQPFRISHPWVVV